MTKMTIIFLGPGFLLALLISKYRKDLLTPWPWLGGVLCLMIVTPYLLWENANRWPTLEYWNNCGEIRMYHASIQQYFTNILICMSPFLMPLYAVGLYRIFRRMNGVNYGFLGLLFLITLVLMYVLLTPARMLAELFIPLLAAGAVFLEEVLARLHWEKAGKVVAIAYLLVIGIFTLPLNLPILPLNQMESYASHFKIFYQPLREFNFAWAYPPVLTGRVGSDQAVPAVARVYDELPAEERAIAGIYSDGYGDASAIDLLGPQYGLPHAVSGSLTYYLWGPGYSWDVMIIATTQTNPISVFFDDCELKSVVLYQFDEPGGATLIFVCRNPKVPAKVIWSSVKSYR